MSTNHSKPELEIVAGKQTIDTIVNRLVRRTIDEIESHNIGTRKPKMIAALLRAVTLGVEQHFAPLSQSYIQSKIDEQIERNLCLGMAIMAGYSEDGFCEALKPLVMRIHEYFAPPSNHPIINGEFTLLIVLPPEWVSLRAQVALLCGSNALPANEILDCALVSGGTKRPRAPYALVGIDGGRKLKCHSFEEADHILCARKLSHFSIHELVQLLLIQPSFLSAEKGAFTAQSEVFALGEQCDGKWVRIAQSALDPNRSFELVKPTQVKGAGVGKPTWTDLITT